MKKKIMSIMALAVLTVSAMLNINDVSAASTTIGDNQSSAQNLTVTKNVENVINNVTNTFTYSISADSNNPGNVTGLPSSLTVAFNDVAPGSSNVATQTATLDLSNVTFTVLGDYKFSIEETASSNPEIYPVDTEHNYTIYVSIRNELAADGKTPTGNLIATLVSQVKNNDTGAKTNILFKTSPLTSLTISNNVTGNLADKDQYFKFKVDIKSTSTGTYTIIGQDATVTYGGQQVTTSNIYTKGQDNYVYLKHGQTVTIGLNGTTREIDAGIEYQVVEQDATDYNTYINGSTSDNKRSTLTALSNDSANNVTAFVNHKETATLTGLFINILPFIVLIALAVVGVYTIKKTAEKNA